MDEKKFKAITHTFEKHNVIFLLFNACLPRKKYVCSIGHLHYDVISPLQPEFFRDLLSKAVKGVCYLELAGLNKFEKNLKKQKGF